MSELKNKSNDCSSVFLHIHYTTFRNFFLTQNIFIEQIFQHLQRTILIQRMTSHLISQLSQLVIGRNYSRANLKTLAVTHIRIGDHNVMSVSMYIKQISYLINTGVRFTHLHIMCPYLNSTDLKLLMNRLPIPFTTSQHLLNHTNFVIDRYMKLQYLLHHHGQLIQQQS